MNTSEFLAVQERVYQSLEKPAKPVRAMMSAKRIKTSLRAAKCALALASSALAATGFWIVSGQHYENTHDAALGCFVYAICAAGIGGVVQGFTRRGVEVDTLLTVKVMSALGVTGEANKEQVNTIVQFAQKHPRVYAACAQWGAQNLSGAFTFADYIRVSQAQNVLKKAETRHKTWTQDEHDRMEIKRSMEESGFSDAIQSNRETRLLENGTPQVSMSSSNRRI